MVEKCRGGYWVITHFNLFIADIPLTWHMHTPKEHYLWQQRGHHATLDGSDHKRNDTKEKNPTIADLGKQEFIL